MSNETTENPLLIPFAKHKTMTLTLVGNCINVGRIGSANDTGSARDTNIGSVQVVPRGPYGNLRLVNGNRIVGNSMVTRTFSYLKVEISRADQGDRLVATSETNHGVWWTMKAVLRRCFKLGGNLREFKFISKTGEAYGKGFFMDSDNVVMDSAATIEHEERFYDEDVIVFEGTGGQNDPYSLKLEMNARLTPLQTIALFHTICLSQDIRKDEEKIAMVLRVCFLVLVCLMITAPHQLLVALKFVLFFAVCCGSIYFCGVRRYHDRETDSLPGHRVGTEPETHYERS